MNVALLCAGMTVLSVGFGRLGPGMAFTVAPFLGFFMSDLVHQVQPLSLFLNGVTALFSLFGFAKSGLVIWRPAILLTVVTTAIAPLVAWLAQHVIARYLWTFYFATVAFLAWRKFLPDKPNQATPGEPNLKLALLFATPILLGYEAKHAAAIYAPAATSPSFSALIPHIAGARVEPSVGALMVVVGAIGSYLERASRVFTSPASGSSRLSAC